MKAILVGLLLVNVSVSIGQELKWASGVAVLDNDSIVIGDVCVQIGYDLALVRLHDAVDVYPAHRLREIRYYDEENNINRRFLSLSKDEERVHLYEVVLGGGYKVVRYPRMVMMQNNLSAEDYNYFIYAPKVFVPLAAFRKSVLPLLSNANEAINTFVSINKLDINRSTDIIRILEFCNKLPEPTIMAMK